MLHENENIHATVVGMAVDYLTRYYSGAKIEEAFKISLVGAKIASEVIGKEVIDDAIALLATIEELNDESIISACKLVTFDVWFRNPMAAMTSKNYKDTNPDKDTIENIKIMVKRGISFFKMIGKVISEGFTFQPNGYTQTVSSGDGDFITKDTMWDFKVSKNTLNNKQTLQLAMYYIMGKHSGNKIYDNIKNIGFFNPRLNIIYTLNMEIIDKEIIKSIEDDVIKY